jgi:hypothetical protein
MHTTKLIASAITVALLAGAVHAAENADGGQPTSTPTHTVPGKPTDRLTIKRKSSPPFAPPIEDEKNTSTKTTQTGLPPRDKDKPFVTNPGQRPDPEPPCPAGWQWVPKLNTCTKPEEAPHDLPKNDPETGSDAGGTLPHPWDPIPPHPRPKPVQGSNPVPVGPHMPRDPGDGSGVGPNPGGNPVEPALPNGPKPIKLDKPIVAPLKLPPPKPVDCRFVKPVPTC